MNINFLIIFALFLSPLAKADVKIITSSKAKKAGYETLFQEGSVQVVTDGKSKDLFPLYLVRFPASPEKSFVKFSELGQIVDLLPGQFALMKVAESQVDELAALAHERTGACGSIIKLDGDLMAKEMAADPLPILPIKESPLVKALAQEITKQNIKSTVETLSAIKTRHYATQTGKEVPDLLAKKYLEIAGGRPDIQVFTIDHGANYPQRSIVVRFKGAAHRRPNPPPVTEGEVVVIGSHIDSINISSGSQGPAPGADDNASGTAVNLEAFRILIEKGVKFERTVEIHGYAAEEIGLVGSQQIAKNYKDTGKKVVAMLQNDMNLYVAPGQAPKIHLVKQSTNAALNEQLTKLIDLYAGVPWAMGSLVWGSSDHASWNRQGYPASFPFENPAAYNHKIHTPSDTIETAGNFEQAAAFAKLTLAFVMHFGGGTN